MEVEITDQQLLKTLRDIRDISISCTTSHSMNKSIDTITLAELKDACKEFLTIPLIVALVEL